MLAKASSHRPGQDIAIISVVGAIFLASLTRVGLLKSAGADMLHLYPLSLSAFVIAALMVAGAVTFVWWRNIDEAAREAHKWSWYWGGSAGLCGVLVLFLLVNLTGGAFGRETIAAWGLSGHGLELGMAVGTLLPTAGYALAWGIWWWRRR